MRDAKESRKPQQPKRYITDDYGNRILYKRCSKCRLWKDREVGFYTDHSYGQCRACKAVAFKAWQEKNRERRLEYQRNWYEGIKDDPYWKAQQKKKQDYYNRNRDPNKRREADRRTRARIYADPERHADFLAKRRIYNRIRREQQGCESHPERGIRHLKFIERDKRAFLPIGPIQEWIKRRILELGSQDALAIESGIDKRRITEYLSPRAKIADFDVVDKLLANTDMRVEDLYPNYKKDVAA